MVLPWWRVFFMPELPEVETIVRELLDAQLRGRAIEQIFVLTPSVVAQWSSTEFECQLAGLTVSKIARRGKYIVFTLSDQWTLLVHLRMTGQLILTDSLSPCDKHQHVRLKFESGPELRFRDVRKFGRWILTKNPAEVLGKLGPEPLSENFSLTWFEEKLCRTKRCLKSLLLDQRFLAGLGNIYADEALWLARLHPLRGANSLNREEVKNLHAAIRKVLLDGIDHGGTSLGKGRGNFKKISEERGGHQAWLQVFRRTGKPCPRCGTAIERLLVAQRGTHICSVCQNGNN